MGETVLDWSELSPDSIGDPAQKRSIFEPGQQMDASTQSIQRLACAAKRSSIRRTIRGE
jgi:hypothetical protein